MTLSSQTQTSLTQGFKRVCMCSTDLLLSFQRRSPSHGEATNSVITKRVYTMPGELSNYVTKVELIARRPHDDRARGVGVHKTAAIIVVEVCV